MHRLFLIRHGAPRAGWGEGGDPGLSDAGRAQALAASRGLPPGLDIVTSPMARCRETAAPYEARIGAGARVDRRFSEVATPVDIADRQAWLADAFPWRDGAGRRDWRTLDPQLHAWREDVLAAARALKRDTAVFSHFIAINVLAGAALGKTETIVFRPAHASITQFTLVDGVLRVAALGETVPDTEVR